MFRSSIFNFESFGEFKPRLPAGLLTAALLVMCVELGMRWVPDTWIFPYYSRLGFRGFMEHEVLPHYLKPSIAIFGTSRSADAIMPKELDEALGLPEKSTVNLSIFGSRTSDWLNLYQRNRAKLSQCKLVIVALDEWIFSSGVGYDEQFNLEAPLSDRLKYVQLAPAPEPINETPSERAKRDAARLDFLTLKRNRLLADWAFNMRMKLNYLPMALAKSLHLGRKREPVFDQHFMVRSSNDEKGKLSDNPLDHHERIRNFYKLFDSHPIYVGHIEELARLVREDGGHLLLLQLPNRQSYQNEVQKLFPQEYRQHIRVTQELAKRIGAEFKHENLAEEIGLVDEDYEDYGHLALTGARNCTTWLAAMITKSNVFMPAK